MSILLALAASSGGTLTTKTFVYNGAAQSFTPPAGVSSLALLTGQGGAGSPASGSTTTRYSTIVTKYVQHNDAGGSIQTTTGGKEYTPGGPPPADYCTSHVPYEGVGGVTNYRWECYDFADASYITSSPATTGGTTTGFGKSWVGGTGGPAPTGAAYKDVAVTSGTPYALSIPFGGSITISYYA